MHDQKIQAVFGRVVGPDPQVSKPSNEITYIIDVSYPDGGTGRVPNVVPADARPDPDIFDTKSVEVGTLVQGFISLGSPQRWFLNEQPDTAPCEPPPGDGN